MPAADELHRIAATIGEMATRFERVDFLGGVFVMEANDEANFHALLTEAKAILAGEFGPINEFSQQLSVKANTILGGPSKSAVQGAQKVIEAAARHIVRKSIAGVALPIHPAAEYVHVSRLTELRSARAPSLDLKRLVRLCEELNIAAEHESHMATAMIVRAILDHVPPLLGHRTFAEVANNYRGGGASFKNAMAHLEKALRNIADSHLHIPIRKSEVLPTPQQVDFRAALDQLLGEIVRVLNA